MIHIGPRWVALVRRWLARQFPLSPETLECSGRIYRRHGIRPFYTYRRTPIRTSSTTNLEVG